MIICTCTEERAILLAVPANCVCVPAFNKNESLSSHYKTKEYQQFVLDEDEPTPNENESKP